MELLIVRHAAAVEAVPDSDGEDAARPLTAKGKKQMRRIVDGIASTVNELDAIATSPLVRAVQTAGILGAAYGNVKPKKLDALAPAGERDGVLSWMQDQGDNDVVAVVGHEPHLGLLASWLLAAPFNHFVEFQKGGACLLGWPDYPTAGSAWLKWALTPKQLRELGKV
jgi:phosphohistidine phosphatase